MRLRTRLQTRRRSVGFTLVEVLVAMLVMAVMAVIGWQGVDGISRARLNSQKRLERTLRLNTVIAQWEQDLASVQETQAVPALLFDGATLRLTRRTEAGMQVVAWSLRPQTAAAAAAAEPDAAAVAGGNAWLRWSSPVVTRNQDLQDQWLTSQQLQGREPGQLRTLEGLSQWQVYFFRGNAWSNAQSSADVQPPEGAGSAPARQTLPTGVRLVLDFADGSGQNGSLTRDVALGPQAP